MALVTPDAGEIELLDKMLKDALSVDESYTLHLYRSDTTPINTTVAGDFTDATFTGYSNQVLTRSTWGPASTNVGNKAESIYGSELAWTCGSTGDTVYGYWVEGTTSGVCLWAERFDSPRTLSQNDVLKITPRFTLNSE